MTVRERLVASATDIRDRGQRLARLNRELLVSELKEKGRRFGAAIALFVGAGVLALYALGFALTTIAVALALVLPLWLSLLIVTVVLSIIVVILALAGRGQVQQAKQEAPQTALAEARKTAELMKANVRETATGVRAKVVPRRTPGGVRAAPPAPTPMPERPSLGDQPPEPPSEAEARDS